MQMVSLCQCETAETKRRRGAAACALASSGCADDELRIEYSGWHPPEQGGAALGAQGLAAEGFWRAHIACRRPAVIRELLPDLHPLLRWTDEHLLSCAVRAQDCLVALPIEE